MAQMPAETFASLLAGPLVDVTVGTSTRKRRWSLHRNLLVYHAPQLAPQLGGGARDSADSGYGSDNDSTSPDPMSPTSDRDTKGRQLTLSFPDDSPAAVPLLIKWLYQGVLDDVSGLDSPERQWEHAFQCQQLYALAQRLGLRALKNQAIDQFRRGCFAAGLVPGPEEMAPVYAATSPGSPFRKLVSRIAARQIMDPDTKRDASTYRACFEASADFAIDVMNEMREGTGGKLLDDPTEATGCVYHDHLEGDECHTSRSGSILKKKVKWST